MLYFVINQDLTTPNMVLVITAALVKHLTKKIIEKKLAPFLNNYVITYNLIQYLDSKLYRPITANRFANSKLPTSHEQLRNDHGWNWWTKYVSKMLQNKKEYVQSPRPEAIRRYNRSMGGVDKLNFLQAYTDTMLALVNIGLITENKQHFEV